MTSRIWVRIRIAALALGHRLRARSRRMPDQPRTVLVIAPLYAGDALLLTPLLAKLRAQYPSGDIYLVAGRAAQ